MSSVIEQYGSNRHPIVNKLGLKRLFALKTDAMGEKGYPPNTPDFEKPGLSIMHFQAYVWKQLQEITIIIIEKLTEDLKTIKKNPSAQLSEVDYSKCTPCQALENLKTNTKANKTLYDDLFGKIDVQKLGEYNNKTINGTINEHNTDIKTPKNSKQEIESYKKQMVQQLNGHIKQLKEEGRICRINKQNIKHDFRKRIEQIKYYLKLVNSGKIQSIRIRYKNGNIDGCDNYDYNWGKYKSKLSETIQTAIRMTETASIIPE